MDDTGSLLAAIVESSDDAIIGKTLEGVITSWNPAAQRLYGYTAQEAVGQAGSMLLPPDCRGEERLNLARGERIQHFETVHWHKDGTPLEVSVSISPVCNAVGETIGAFQIARDIGQSRRTQAALERQSSQLRLLGDLTRAIAQHQDLQTVFKITVQALEERMGLDLACVCLLDEARQHLVVARSGLRSATLVQRLVSEAQGRIALDANGLSHCLRGLVVYEPDTRETSLPFLQQLARAGLGCVVMSPLQSDRAVSGVLLAARARPRAFEDDECEFLYQLSAQVSLATQYTELYRSLQRAYDDLRASHQVAAQHERLRALGQMACGVAHDINNGVSAALLFGQDLLENEPNLTPQGRQQFQNIVQAMSDVVDTVERLRNFYRPREPQETMAPLSLNALVEQVLALSQAHLSDVAKRHGTVFEVRTDLAADTPAVVGVESEIRDALVNLVFNAIDAMPHGGTLTLSTRSHAPCAANAHGAQVEVGDTGIGMDEATRQRCLDPFFTTKGEQGTGLGLSMVYGMAQRHGAELRVHSEPGRGTTITLGFPPPVVHA